MVIWPSQKYRKAALTGLILVLPLAATHGQRPVRVEILPPIFDSTPGQAAHMQDDLPLKLVVSLSERNSGIHACLISRTLLDSLASPSPVPGIDALAAGQTLPDRARCARGDTLPYLLAIELATAPAAEGSRVSEVLARFVAFAPARTADQQPGTGGVPASQPRALVLDDTVTVLSTEEEYLASYIADRLIIRLTKDIRIAITDFRLTSGDSTKYASYGRALPHMLATRLDSSRPSRLMLLEYSAGDSSLLQDQMRTLVAGLADPLTVVQRGRELLANYVILGDYLVLGETLRIDVRCVSVESRAVIASRGVSIDPITVQEIDERFAQLASDLRSVIEEDFTERANRPRYVAIAGIRPIPNSGENQGVTQDLVRTLERKLAQLTETRLRVREQLDEARLWPGSESRWNLATALNADIVVRLRLDRTLRDHPRLESDIFDTEQPDNTSTLPSLSAPIEALGTVLDTIAVTLYREKATALNDSARVRLSQVDFRGSERSTWLDLAIGLSAHTSSALYLDAGGGGVVRVAPNVLIHGHEALQWEPIGLRFDLWGMKGGGHQTVVGFDVFSSLARRLRRYRAVSPFVGFSAGLLGVVRLGAGDQQIDGVPGVGLIAGIEHTLASGRRVRYRLEFTQALMAIQFKTLAEEPFPGGRPGGLVFTVSTTRGF